MKIKILKYKGTPCYGRIADVYVIYWVDGRVHYMAATEFDDDLDIYNDEDSEITDPYLSNRFLVTSIGSKPPMIIHEALLQDNLLERVIEGGPDEFKRFKERLLNTK